MSIISDLSTFTGMESYQTLQGLDESELQIEFLTTELSDVVGLVSSLPSSPSYSEVGVELINGDTISLYGYEDYGVNTENVLVMIVSNSSYDWLHVFSYGSNADYLEGKAAQVPPAEMRV
jgi:hypothetical protein